MSTTFSFVLIIFYFNLWLSPSMPSTIGEGSASTGQNVVIFLADDIGYSDLGCFGNKLIATPNIDRLAQDGIKLNRMYSVPSEAASFASLLTGRQPLRMGLVKGMFGWPSFWSVAQYGGIPQYEMNIAKYYEMKGNDAFLFGRWGLGSYPWSLPSQQGFGGFYGTVTGHSPSCSSNPEDILTDSEYFWMMFSHIAPLLVTIIVLLATSKMLAFIRMRFFTFSVLIICVSVVVFRTYCWMLPLNNVVCKIFENSIVKDEFYNDTTLNRIITDKAIHYLKFRKKSPFLLIVSFHQPGHPSFTSTSFQEKSGINKYYDSIIEVDASVGEIMDTLDNQGLSNNTVIFFLSDNGPVLTDPYKKIKLKHASKMTELRGEKGSVLEGGLRVPAIVKWPGVISPGQETSVVTSLIDIFPTIQYLTGEPNQIQRSNSRAFDGKTLMPIFKNPNTQSDEIHKLLLHYCTTGDISAATVGDLKVHFGSQNYTQDCIGGDLNNPVIYNIVKDPREITPLDTRKYDNILAKIKLTVAKFELSLEIKKRSIRSQFDQIPLPWNMWVSK